MNITEETHESKPLYKLVLSEQDFKKFSEFGVEFIQGNHKDISFRIYNQASISYCWRYNPVTRVCVSDVGLNISNYRSHFDLFSDERNNLLKKYKYDLEKLINELGILSMTKSLGDLCNGLPEIVGYVVMRVEPLSSR